MPLTRKLVGRRLRSARVTLGFDPDDFAAEIGLSHKEYQRIEQGEDEPPLGALVHASKITGKSLDFLLTGKRFRLM